MQDIRQKINRLEENIERYKHKIDDEEKWILKYFEEFTENIKDSNEGVKALREEFENYDIKIEEEGISFQRFLDLIQNSHDPFELLAARLMEKLKEYGRKVDRDENVQAVEHEFVEILSNNSTFYVIHISKEDLKEYVEDRVEAELNEASAQ